MPRKSQTSSSLTDMLAAVRPENPVTSERASTTESAKPPERAGIAESTAQPERAKIPERTDVAERAKLADRTSQPERADPSERTPLLERALHAETPKEPERRFSFVNKVRITDGFQYHGSFTDVPKWADRNWLQYDGNPPKPYPKGPALFLPDKQVCRLTDWVVQEETAGMVRLVVYSDEQMQHFFSVTPSRT